MWRGPRRGRRPRVSISAQESTRATSNATLFANSVGGFDQKTMPRAGAEGGSVQQFSKAGRITGARHTSHLRRAYLNPPPFAVSSFLPLLTDSDPFRISGVQCPQGIATDLSKDKGVEQGSARIIFFRRTLRPACTAGSSGSVCATKNSPHIIAAALGFFDCLSLRSTASQPASQSVVFFLLCGSFFLFHYRRRSPERSKSSPTAPTLVFLSCSAPVNSYGRRGSRS